MVLPADADIAGGRGFARGSAGGFACAVAADSTVVAADSTVVVVDSTVVAVDTVAAVDTGKAADPEVMTVKRLAADAASRFVFFSLLVADGRACREGQQGTSR